MIPESVETYLRELLDERSEAVKKRRACGIEDVWQAARAQYHHGTTEGTSSSAYEKGETVDSSLRTNIRDRRGSEKRSTVCLNITRPYTNAGIARALDILQPTGDRENWDLRKTPVSDVELLRPFLAERPQIIEQLPPGLQDVILQSEEERDRRIAACRQLIRDYLIETGNPAATRKQIVEAGITGTGVLHAVYPKDRNVSPEVQAAIEALIASAPSEEERNILSFRLRMSLLVRPAVSCIPVENCYPDPCCGADIQDGEFFWQLVPDLSNRRLRQLRTVDGYFSEVIDEVLEEGPKPIPESGLKEQKSYEIWRRTGEVEVSKLRGETEFLEVIAKFLGKPVNQLSERAFMQLEFINDKLVKVNSLPIDTQEFPYRFLTWEDRTDRTSETGARKILPYGIGIPEQIETPQRGANTGTRAASDNLGWSVGPGILRDDGLIDPDDDEDNNHYPYKVYRIVYNPIGELTGKERDPRKAIQFLEFPNYLGDILPWINFWLEMAERTTGLPNVFQGQKSSDAVGVTQALAAMGSANLRLFVRRWDDNVCKKIINDCFAWIQQHGSKDLRTDATAQPLGSALFLERELDFQLILQLLDRSVQSIFGLSPKQLARRLLEARGLAYEDVQLTPEELEKLQAAEQTPDPKLQVEELRGQVDMQIAELRSQTESMKAMLDAQLKGMSIDQAREAVHTQGLMNVAQEMVKKENVEKKKGIKPSKHSIPVSISSPDDELTDEDFASLGL